MGLLHPAQGQGVFGHVPGYGRPGTHGGPGAHLHPQLYTFRHDHVDAQPFPFTVCVPVDTFPLASVSESLTPKCPVTTAHPYWPVRAAGRP